MRLELQIKFSCPVKSFSPITIPVSSIVKQKIDIKISGHCDCHIENNIAEISADLKLTALNSLIPDALLNFGRNAIKELVADKIIKRLRDSGLLIEHKAKIDGKTLGL